MADNSLNVLGVMRGKLGNIVGIGRGSVQLYRGYLAHIRNPRTAGQLLTRARFAALGSVARAFSSAAAIGFAKAKKSVLSTGMSTFMRKNWSAVSGETPAATEVDLTQLMVSDGNLPSPGFNSASMEQALQVDVTFRADSDQPDTDPSDKVYIVVYQADLNGCVVGEPVLRSAQRAAVTVPSGWSGMRVNVYGFAVGGGVKNNGKRSRTTYLGSGTIV